MLLSVSHFGVRMERLALRAALVLALLAIAGCASLSSDARQALSVVVPHDVDFEELRYYAVRSNSAYDDPATIRKTYPDVTRVATIASVDVRYFLETDHTNRTQTLSVRGTAAKPNIWQDIEIALTPDQILGIQMHRGFREDSLAVWKDVEPHMRKDYAVRITGHSLGAAIAAILAGYSNADGYNVVRLVNFGQPKFTSDIDPGGQFDEITTRVIDDRDVVPMVPPPGFIPKYRHLGPEVILRPGNEYVYLDAHDSDRVSVDDFWNQITHFSVEEHFMKNYLANIEFKIENGANQVPYFSGRGGS